MPTVVNGIGTWYYGKRRIHRRQDVCSFCNAVGELTSYDTTLFFVVFFIPILPLSRKRILEQCPTCQQHRVLSLKKWEEIKAQDTTEVLARLQQNPDDRDSILAALRLAASYQDEKLFDQVAAALATHRHDDAVVQAQLGAGYAYFVRWAEAEAAYRASLAVEDSPEVHERLAFVLLKQGRPDEAQPHLRHILDRRVQQEAGMIYLLIEGYQAQGRHAEALQLMDERDAAFPDLVELKDYKRQRKTSERYRDSGKKIASAFLTESRRAGYEEGSWLARAPRLIAPILIVGLLIAYLIAAIWIGQSRKVYLVNGLDKPYRVAINGREQTLTPGVPTPLRVPEGEVAIEFRDANVPLEPVRCRVETSFFTRPFARHTFVVNPDQLAIVFREETVYSEQPLPVSEPSISLGKVLHSFQGLDYEFAPFPPSVKARQGETIRKTRVGLPPDLTPTTRLQYVGALGDAQREAQRSYVQRWLQIDPNNLYALSWLVAQLKDEDALEMLRPGLAARPLRIEWHRAYQQLMGRLHPDHDLRPEYEKLAAELKEQADASYLLGRVLPMEEAEELFRRAAGMEPPSMYGVHAIGYDALARGQFAEAVSWTERAIQMAPDNPGVRQTYRAALLAAREYDRLLQDLQSAKPASGPDPTLWVEQVRILSARGNQEGARAFIEQSLGSLPQEVPNELRQLLRSGLESVRCAAAGDMDGYLAAAPAPQGPPFEVLLLRGRLSEAAESVGNGSGDKDQGQNGLLYLAAHKAGDMKLAEAQWQALVAALEKDDRHTRRLGQMLAGRQPLQAETVLRLPIDPKQKRVLLAAVACRHPQMSKELLELARKLDFYHDPTSLCLRWVAD